jgi:hypothetical protein
LLLLVLAGFLVSANRGHLARQAELVQVVADLVQRKSESGGEVLGGGPRLEEGLGPLPEAVKGLL